LAPKYIDSCIDRNNVANSGNLDWAAALRQQQMLTTNLPIEEEDHSGLVDYEADFVLIQVDNQTKVSLNVILINFLSS
jgi:hypothetical protein